MMSTLTMDFPEELVLMIISHLPLQGLIKARGVSKHWRALIEDPLTQVSPSRRRLLDLYLKVVHSSSFLQTRDFNLHDLRPDFNRKEFLDNLLAAYRLAVSNPAFQLSDLPEQFVLWILEYPSRAIFGRFWPGLPQVYYSTHAKPQLYGSHSLSKFRIHQMPVGGLTSTESIPCLNIWAEHDGDTETRWMTLCAAKQAHPGGSFEKAGTLCKCYHGRVFATWEVDDWVDGLEFMRAAAGGRAVI